MSAANSNAQGNMFICGNGASAGAPAEAWDHNAVIDMCLTLAEVRGRPTDAEARMLELRMSAKGYGFTDRQLRHKLKKSEMESSRSQWVPSTFTRFSELSNELQLKIWEYAAEPYLPVPVNGEFLNEIFARGVFCPGWGTPKAYESLLLHATGTGTYTARSSLRDVSVRARTVAFKTWRKDIAAVHPATRQGEARKSP